MMDVSDGLLLDALRLAEASGCSVSIDLDALPLSRAFIAERGHDSTARLFAATGGDDYALLAALAPEFDPATLSLPSGTRITRIGSLSGAGHKLRLTRGGEPVELPETLGFEHKSDLDSGLSASPMADRP
jgi:thiamine-monophosphate kinase